MTTATRNRPITYLAEGGQLVQTPEGARLIMNKGTIEQADAGGARLSMLKFDRYVFDLDQFSSPQRYSERAASERYLPELFWPDPNASFGQGARDLSGGRAQQARLAALLPELRADRAGSSDARRRGRGAHALRLTIASLLAVGLRIAGLRLCRVSRPIIRSGISFSISCRFWVRARRLRF